MIGTTGSPAKARRLVDDLGYDVALLRSDERPFAERLRAAAPEGVDAVIDLVGGEQLVAAVDQARRGGRIAVIGALGSQVGGGTGETLPVDTMSLLLRSLTLRGLAGAAFPDDVATAEAEFTRLLRAGELTFPHTVLSGTPGSPGIERAPRGLIELLEGRHTGTLLVAL